MDLALKDLSQILRDKKSLLFLVAMPVVFTLFMGFAYRSGGKETTVADTRILLAVVDPQPEASLNKKLYTSLEATDGLKPVRMGEVEALADLQKDNVGGVLVIPAGFGNVAEDPAQLKLIARTDSLTGQSLFQLLRRPVAQLMSAVEIARISADIVGSVDEFGPALDMAWSGWEANSQAKLVRMEKAVAGKSEDWTGGNPYNQASPGILVQFAIFGLVTSAQILVQERKSRTLQRLMTTAMRPWEIVAGHLLAMFTLTFLQTAMLVIFGQLVLNVNYLSEPIGTLLVSVGLGLWVASMGLLIGVLAKGEDQVILFSMIAMFLFSALGGTWFPLESAGGGFAAVGRLMPSAWAMTGMQNILIRGLGLASVWEPAGILLLYSLGFFGLAVWRFRKNEM